jgi:ubiquitin-protein ligase E3 C
LTHLSQKLPLFTTLLPAAAANPTLLTQEKLSTELGRTYFLANITTFGITGGMLARYGAQGANTWVQVIATLLGGVKEGWGKWAEGVVEPDSESEDEKMDVDSDSDSEAEPSKIIITKRRRVRRTPLPKNVSSKLLLLGSSSHISTLADLLVSSAGGLSEFADFTLGLLTAFKGSPRWEAILDGLLEGKRGVALTRRMWREGVRGRWGTTRDQISWQSFTTSTSSSLFILQLTPDPSMPCLILMTHLYCHYLLLTPDDEFFATTNRTNPLSSDEILELGAIWRDLAFWGYMLGVSPNSDYNRVGDEETRALFTKGVTRMAARK